MAERWLRRNPNNRHLRKAVIESYARDMASGSWVLNCETIKIDATGHLLDGQHRLSAVILAKATVPMIVVSGMHADVMPTVDTGAKRSYSDALKLQGEENTATLAAVTGRAAMWQRGVRTNTGAMRPNPLEMNAFNEENQRVRTSADLASRLATRSLLPASVTGLCHQLFSDLDSDDAG